MELKPLARNMYRALVPDTARIMAHRVIAKMQTYRWNTTHPSQQALSFGLLSSLIPPNSTQSPHQISPYDVLLFSANTWNAVGSIQQHFATHLAQQGHRLFFFEIGQFTHKSDASYAVNEVAPKVYRVLLNDDNIAPLALRREYAIYAAIMLVQTPQWAQIALQLRKECGWPLVYDDVKEKGANTPTLLRQQRDDLQTLQMQSDLLSSVSTSGNAQPQIAPFETAIAALFQKVSIILVTYNNLALTTTCIESILRNTTYPNYEIIIVDNCSTDETRVYLRQLEQTETRVRVMLNEDNKGFAAANNQGIRAADGTQIVLLNNDTVVPRGWLWRLSRYLSDPSIGLVGPRTNYCKGAAIIDVPYRNFAMMEIFAAEYMAQNEGKMFDIGTLIMFCVAARRDVIDQVGLLDENFGIGMYEDDDYSERVRRAGYRIICAGDIFVHHHGNASFKKIPSKEYQLLLNRNRAYFEQKWGRKADDD